MLGGWFISCKHRYPWCTRYHMVGTPKGYQAIWGGSLNMLQMIRIIWDREITFINSIYSKRQVIMNYILFLFLFLSYSSAISHDFFRKIISDACSGSNEALSLLITELDLLLQMLPFSLIFYLLSPKLFEFCRIFFFFFFFIK
jgi:hypothetical protein